MTFRVFLPHGPLHVLFVLSLIQAEPEQPALILLFADIPDWARLAAGLRDLLPAPHRVQVLPGRFSYPHTLQHPAYRRLPPARLTDHLPLVLAVRRALAFTHDLPVDQVLVFNDMRPDVQQIAARLKARHACSVTYVEDGTAAYVDTLPARTLHAKRLGWAFRLVYGRHFQRVSSQGQFAALDSGCLLFPEYANRALSRLPLTPLPPLTSTPDTLRHLFALPAASAPASAAAQVALICPPRSRSISPALRDHYDTAIRRCAAQGLTPLLKLHPREEYPHVFGGQGAIRLEASIPSEAVVAWLGPRLHRLVSGGISTTLHTTRWLNPAAEIVLLHAAGEVLPPGLEKLYRAARVTLEEVRV